ncbi:MAG TPA: hypothetical protein VK635_00200, partial [Bradyrhizobium sp.]|nr:hypothetical protein [Bradyrhizobium sp.]
PSGVPQLPAFTGFGLDHDRGESKLLLEQCDKVTVVRLIRTQSRKNFTFLHSHFIRRGFQQNPGLRGFYQGEPALVSD